MAVNLRWYYTEEEIENTVSRKDGIDANQELINRRLAANFIQEMGMCLRTSQLCINTAISMTHRFYMICSFSRFQPYDIARSALFLAAKIENTPIRLEYVVKAGHMCLHGTSIHSKNFKEEVEKAKAFETEILSILGFDLLIDHPHTYVLRCCELLKTDRTLAHTAYVLATMSLHLTTLGLQYKPSAVGCACVYLACKWANWKISHSEKNWFLLIDETITAELIQEIVIKYIEYLEKQSIMHNKMLMRSLNGDKSDKNVWKKLRSNELSVNGSNNCLQI